MVPIDIFGDSLDYLFYLKYVIEHSGFLIEGRREQAMTQAKIHTFCIFANIDCIGYLKGKVDLHNWVKQKNKCFHIYNNTFSAIFESEEVKVKQSAEEVNATVFMETKLWVMIV